MNVGINDIFMEYGNGLPNLVSTNMAGCKIPELNGGFNRKVIRMEKNICQLMILEEILKFGPTRWKK